MERKKLELAYEEYANENELPAADRALLQQARTALAHSYSPYSQFQVAAAVRLHHGDICTGANTENAAYPMCLCAERAALAAASSAYPQQAVVAIAITVHNARVQVVQPAAPCGACRQVLTEYEEKGGQPIRIILQGDGGPIVCFAQAKDLLPFGFSGAFL